MRGARWSFSHDCGAENRMVSAAPSMWRMCCGSSGSRPERALGIHSGVAPLLRRPCSRSSCVPSACITARLRHTERTTAHLTCRRSQLEYWPSSTTGAPGLQSAREVVQTSADCRACIRHSSLR